MSILETFDGSANVHVFEYQGPHTIEAVRRGNDPEGEVMNYIASFMMDDGREHTFTIDQLQAAIDFRQKREEDTSVFDDAAKDLELALGFLPENQEPCPTVA